jgi:hypothetical protein
MVCDVISAAAEFMVRVLHSWSARTRTIGMHNVAGGHHACDPITFLSGDHSLTITTVNCVATLKASARTRTMRMTKWLLVSQM